MSDHHQCLTSTVPDQHHDYRESDRLWLGLETTDGGRRSVLEVRPELVNPGGALYGGAAVATAVTLMESLTDRFVVWTTVQFVASCGVGEILEMDTVVSAAGRRTSQLRVVATVAGREIFVALGALGTARPGGLDGQWEVMPDVSPPQDSEPLTWSAPSGWQPPESSHLDLGERRVAVPEGPAEVNRLLVWSRMKDHPSASPAMMGWQADMLGMAVAQARPGITGGTSLDNTIRFGRPVESDWVLVDMRAHAMVDGYGHGTVHLWSEAGVLVATAAQTCIMRPRTP